MEDITRDTIKYVGIDKNAYNSCLALFNTAIAMVKRNHCDISIGKFFTIKIKTRKPANQERAAYKYICVENYNADDNSVEILNVDGAMHMYRYACGIEPTADGCFYDKYHVAGEIQQLPYMALQTIYDYANTINYNVNIVFDDDFVIKFNDGNPVYYYIDRPVLSSL